MACQTIVSDIKDHQHVQQQIDEPVQVTYDVTTQEKKLSMFLLKMIKKKIESLGITSV